MKGNHELNATDIAPPVCGGDRKRGQRPRQVSTKRNYPYARKRNRNGHSNGVGRGAARRKAPADRDFAESGSTLSFGNGTKPGKQGSLNEAMEARPLKFITTACAGEQLNG